MRDPQQMLSTLEAIRANGSEATKVNVAPCGYVWQAGAVTLNSQAVRDLINDGWLRETPTVAWAVTYPTTWQSI